jgi:hypothetical protein
VTSQGIALSQVRATTDTLDLAMQKCLQCNSLLRSDETVCFTCQAAAPDGKSKKTFNDHFRMVLDGFVIFIAIITVGALLTDFFPPFKKCAAVLGILILVKKSADHMSEYRDEG